MSGQAHPNVTATGSRRRAHRLARRLVPAGAVVALLAAGCQSQPGAAAFVGNDRIPQTRVDTLAAASISAAKRTVKQADRVTLRRQVTGELVIDALLSHRAAALGVSVTDTQVNQALDKAAQQAGGRSKLLAQEAQQGISEELLTIRTRDQLYAAGIEQKIGAANPTENELRAAYNQAGGKAKTGVTFAQAKPQLVQYVQGQKLQQDLTSFARSADVRVNPRNGKFDASSLNVVVADSGLVSTSGKT